MFGDVKPPIEMVDTPGASSSTIDLKLVKFNELSQLKFSFSIILPVTNNSIPLVDSLPALVARLVNPDVDGTGTEKIRLRLSRLYTDPSMVSRPLKKASSAPSSISRVNSGVKF